MAASSSFGFTTPLIAPIADAPQIENPVAIRSGWWPGRRNSRPIQNVPTNLSSTMATVVTIVTQPRSAMSPRLSLSPSSTTPTRIRRLALSGQPGRERVR